MSNRSRKKTQLFFQRLFGKTNGLIEIRALPSGRQIFNRELKKLLAFIQAHIYEDVYFGVATRKGGDGSKAGVLEIPALWADMDWKDLIGGKAEADRRIENFPLRPTVIISSGHGYHLYWFLKKPIIASPEIEGFLKGIAISLGADTSAAELARILRVPGTFNHKYGEKLLVTRTIDNGLRYDLQDFEKWKIEIPKVAKKPVSFTDTLVEIDLQKLKLSPRIMELILNGWQGDPYKTRSEADQAVITSLVQKRISNDDIRAIFQRYAIGAKYREKKQLGDKYLANSISKAKAYLAVEKEKNVPPLKRPPSVPNGRNGKLRIVKVTKKMDESKYQTAQKHITRRSRGPIKVAGKLHPLVKKGPRVMICVDYKVIPTRFHEKDYLYWCEEDSDLELIQHFNHDEPYSIRSKAVTNYLIALEKDPKELDHIDLEEIVGLKAEVSVKTVTKTSDGKPKPTILHESKVDQILRPIGRVNVDLLNKLKMRRKKYRK